MNPYNNLLYCRQYIFCQKEIPELSGWNNFIIDNYKLYVHPNLTVSSIKGKGKELYLLGSLFDHKKMDTTNEEILDKLIISKTFEEFLQDSENYTGRFILIFKQNSSLKIFHDPSASRRIYYYMNGSNFCFASQPFLIAKYFSIEKTKKPEILQCYDNSTQALFHEKTGVLHSTIYEPIKRLLPNWYIDVDKREVMRFWPYRKLNPISLNEGVESVSSMLKGFIKNIHHRNKLIMALTSGNDSRLLLAASRDICDDVFYYIFLLPRMKDEYHPDVVVPKKIMNRIKLKENVILYNTTVDEDFKEIYFKNNEFASEANLPIIYNFMYKQCAGRLNLVTSMSDVTRNFFQTTRKIITPELMATIWQYKNNPYAIEHYRNWLNEIKPLATKCNYSILDLFNWEERVAVWNASYASDTDIARDEASPFCSRRLLEIMLSVPKKYRDLNTNIFHRTMIKHMWPELAEFPYNPIFRRRASYILKKAKVYWVIRSIVRGW
jgi:hypothetical protein